MNAATFARHRARIAHQHHGRGRKYSRALAHLVNEARAVLVVMHRKVVGYRLPTGEMVCVKERYRDEFEALDAMERIQADIEAGKRAPVRIYPCHHCKGWHLTSQHRNESTASQ